MKLGVNGWRLQGTLTGVGRYLLNVLRHWDDATARAVFDQISLYTSRPVGVDGLDLPSSIERRVLRPDARMLIWENARLGPFVDDDLLFCPSHSRPLWTRSRTVVAVHDALPHRRPELFPWSVRVFYRRLYDWSSRHATLVITASEAARDDLASCGISAAKIRVVSMAAAEAFRPLDPGNTEHVDVRQRLVGDSDPFFLFVGKLSGRRSIPLLFEGFAEFKRHTTHPHKLVLVGLNPHKLEIAKMIRELGIADDVHYPGYITDAELNVLYNETDALISPATYETVSLPVMEAQATGAPVICIDTDGMREVTGGVAVLMPKLEARELLVAMTHVAEDATLRQQLSRQGLKHSTQFSWKRTAADTMAVLEEAAQMNPDGVSA